MRSLEQDVEFFLVDGPGYTEDEAYAFLAGIGRETSTLPPLTAAANEGHTGAMIALVPSARDVKRLALKGGEKPDQLHLTLAFLGEAKDITEKSREQILNIARRYAKTPIDANAFAVNVFNPRGEEPCVVLGVGNGDSSLESLRSNVVSAVGGMAGFSMPEQHTPWVPHVTIAYTDDFSIVTELADRTGAITFDKIRVAFGDEVTDVPLSQPETAAFWKSNDHPRDSHGQFTDKINLTDVQLTRESDLKTTPGQGLRPGNILGQTKNGKRRVVIGPGWTGQLQERDSAGNWSVTARDKFHFETITRIQGEKDKFFVPTRDDEHDYLPTASPTAHNTSSQLTGVLADRFQGATTGRAVLTTAKNIEDFSGTPSWKALYNYRGEAFGQINARLRSGKDGDAAIDNALASSTTNVDVVVYRGVEHGSRVFGKAWNPEVGSMVDVKYRDLAYASTSADWQVAHAFTDDQTGVVIKMMVPKGTHAVTLTNMRMKNAENELLLDRGLTYRIVGDHIENGMRTLDVEVMS